MQANSGASVEIDLGEFDDEDIASHANCGFSIPASELAQRPISPRRWIVPDFVPDRSVVMLAGDGGSGKTLATLQLAVSMASGSSWLGRTPMAGGCVFASAEDELDELHRRLADICAATNIDLASLADLHIVPLAGKDATLAHFPGGRGPITPTTIFQSLAQLVLKLRPKLLVIDTLADAFGGNENDRGQTRAFIGMLRGLALEANLAVLICSHPSRSGKDDGSGMSGSTGWSNSVRARLYLTDGPRGEGEAPDPNTRTLKVMKSNYGASGAEIAIRWHAGVFETLAELPPEQRAEAARSAEEAVEKVFLDLLHAAIVQGRSVGHKLAKNYAPACFQYEPAAKAAGLRSTALAAAMNRLFSKQMIHVEEYGPPSKRRERLAIGAAPTASSGHVMATPSDLPTPLPTPH